MKRKVIISSPQIMTLIKTGQIYLQYLSLQDLYLQYRISVYRISIYRISIYSISIYRISIYSISIYRISIYSTGSQSTGSKFLTISAVSLKKIRCNLPKICFICHLPAGQGGVVFEMDTCCAKLFKVPNYKFLHYSFSRLVTFHL